jgi:hypothetical protein
MSYELRRTISGALKAEEVHACTSAKLVQVRISPAFRHGKRESRISLQISLELLHSLQISLELLHRLVLEG